jgi:hypothetical protein
MNFLTRSLTLLVLALAHLPFANAENIEIKQRWAPGKKYFLSIQMVQNSTITMGTEKMEQGTTMRMEMTMTVRPYEDGRQKRMTLRYERLAIEFNMNGQKMGYDSLSAAAGTDPLGLAKSAGAIVGKELKVLLDEGDKITKIENYEEFITQMNAGSTPGLDPRIMFSQESLKQMVTQAGLLATPGKPLAAGESWPFSAERVVPQFGTVTINGKYQFKGMAQRWGAECAEILTEGTLATVMTPAAESKTAPVQPAKQFGMSVTEGKVKGTVWFDNQLGAARETQIVQDMTISMQNAVDTTQTITVPMKQTISVMLTKVEDLK